MKFEEMEDMFSDLWAEDKEPCEFKRVKSKLSKLADLHAFLLISQRFPKIKGSMLGNYSGGQIYFGPGSDEFPKKIPLTKEDIVDLVRCGVFMDRGCFSMFL